MSDLMQHRHFVHIAQTIAAFECSDVVRESLARHFADELHQTNDNFNDKRFIACALGKPSNGRDR